MEFLFYDIYICNFKIILYNFLFMKMFIHTLFFINFLFNLYTNVKQTILKNNKSTYLNITFVKGIHFFFFRKN